MTAEYSFDQNLINTNSLLAKGHPIVNGKIHFSSKDELLQGASLWHHHEFNLVETLTEANKKLDRRAMHSMLPEQILAVNKQYETSLQALLDKLVKSGAVQISIPENGGLREFHKGVASEAKLKATADLDTWKQLNLIDLGVDSLDSLLDQFPTEAVVDFAEGLDLSWSSVNGSKILDFLFGESETASFSTEKQGVIKYITNRSYEVSINEEGQSWRVVFDRNFILKLLADKDKRAISNLIRWSNKGEYELFFDDSDNVIFLDNESFRAIQNQIINPLIAEFEVQGSNVFDKAISRTFKASTVGKIIVASDFERLEAISKVQEVLFKLYSISFSGFLPKEACQSAGVYLYDCLATGNPVDIQYFFCPNYDLSSPNKISPTISEHRIHRLEVFAKIKNIFVESGIPIAFNFYYDDTSEHLEYKVNQYYSNKGSELESLMQNSYEDLEKACAELVGDCFVLHRLTKTEGFGEYFQQVQSLHKTLLSDNRYLPLIIMIAEEDMASESRHRVGLSKFTCQSEAAKRLAQGIAGTAFFASQTRNKKSIIITMETNTKELGFFVDTKAAKRYGIDFGSGVPMVLNLQKKVKQ